MLKTQDKRHKRQDTSGKRQDKRYKTQEIRHNKTQYFPLVSIFTSMTVKESRIPSKMFILVN